MTVASLHTLPQKLLCHTLLATLFATLLVLPGLLFKDTGGGHHSSGNAHESSTSPTRATSSWWVSLLPWHFPDSKKTLSAPRSATLLLIGSAPEQLPLATDYGMEKEN